VNGSAGGGVSNGGGSFKNRGVWSFVDPTNASHNSKVPVGSLHTIVIV
jgi:hypothetical protein